MKYTQDNGCNRCVDTRLLGQMLGTCEPVNADYRRRARSRGCSCRTGQNEPRYSNMGTCCEGGMSAHREEEHYDYARLGSACESSPSLAMAYSPFQYFHELYSTEEALERGTLFRELDKPWRV